MPAINYFMKKNSFTLIEATISIFFLTTGIIAVASMISSTFVPFSISSQRLTALYLAQEGIEIIRNIKDTNYLERTQGLTISWDEGLTNCLQGCEVDYTMTSTTTPNLTPFGVTGRYLCIENNGFFGYNNCSQYTTFKRKMIINPLSEKLEITAEVTWEERGRKHKVEVKENIYNW